MIITVRVEGRRVEIDLEQAQRRMLQHILEQAMVGYWERRSHGFADVGTPQCDEIAQACANHAEALRRGWVDGWI